MTPTPITEAAFQKSIIDLAHRLNWRVAHFRTAQTSKGAWLTPVAADGAGFPDLVCTRERIVFIELKSATGRLSDAQTAWAESIHRAGGEYYCFKPADWDEIERVLRSVSSIDTGYEYTRRDHLRRITELGQEIERGAAA